MSKLTKAELEAKRKKNRERVAQYRAKKKQKNAVKKLPVKSETPLPSKVSIHEIRFVVEKRNGFSYRELFWMSVSALMFAIVFYQLNQIGAL